MSTVVDVAVEQMERAVHGLAVELRVYPPETASQRYERTGFLRSSVSTQVMVGVPAWASPASGQGSTVVGIVRVSAHYAGYVLGERQRAAAQAAGWVTAREVLAGQIESIRARFAGALLEVVVSGV